MSSTKLSATDISCLSSLPNSSVDAEPRFESLDHDRAIERLEEHSGNTEFAQADSAHQRIARGAHDINRHLAAKFFEFPGDRSARIDRFHHQIREDRVGLDPCHGPFT